MGVVRNLSVRAVADFSSISKQSKKASSSVVSMVSSINQSTSKLTAAAGGLKRLLGAAGIGLSITGLIHAGKEALAAYQEVEAANTKLAAVMRNTMGASRAEYEAILELTSAQQALGVIQDDVQVSGAQELATYLGLSSSLKTLIPVMNDMLAQQYGLNATSENAVNIATMMGKVMNGQTGALSRYGYSFTEAQAAILKYGDEEQRAATLAEVVTQSVGGMNAALAATPSGRLTQVRNVLGDIKEEFGRAALTIATTFLPLLQRVAAMLSTIAAWANRVAQAIANVFGKKTTSTGPGGTGAAVGGLGAVTDAANNATGAMEGTAKAAKKLTAMNWDELNMLQPENTSGAGGGGGIADDIGGALGGIDWSSTDEAAESCTALERILNRLKETVSKMDFEPLRASWERLKESAGHLAEVVGGYLADVYTNVMAPLAIWTINEAAPRAVKLLADVVADLALALDNLRPIISVVEMAFVKLVQFVGDVILSVAQIIWDTATMFTQVFTGKISAAQETLLKLGDDFVDFFYIPARVFPDFCATMDNLFNRAGETVKTFFSNMAKRHREYWEADKADWKAQFDWIVSGSRDMVEKISSAVKSALDKIKSLISSIKTAISETTISGGTFLGGYTPRTSTSTSSSYSLQAAAAAGDSRAGAALKARGYASGGFPQSASLFYANENGVPEYIGRMGGATAVANSDQITAGISGAVLEAIRSTGLLETVRDIADSSERTARKEFSLGSPSSSTGRWISQSLSKYETVRGRA